jgi:hypothetical protein
MLQRDGVVMVEMEVLVMRMMVMMIPMKSSAMMMTMATISPLREGISLADFCLPECHRGERAYATGWLKLGPMDTVGSGGGKTR